MVVALVRPDLQVTLVEPLLRRVTFLSEVVDALELSHVTIVRGRADEVPGRFDAVASRAVARLPQLLRWCVPLARAGGAAVAELEESRELWQGDVLGRAEVRTVEGPGGFSPVTFVRVPVRKAVKVGWGVAAQRAATKRSGRRK
jgi:16S rRNA (guanine527-N7)-methyltransferase